MSNADRNGVRKLIHPIINAALARSTTLSQLEQQGQSFQDAYDFCGAHRHKMRPNLRRAGWRVGRNLKTL